MQRKWIRAALVGGLAFLVAVVGVEGLILAWGYGRPSES
jgi:hypothetical protein